MKIVSARILAAGNIYSRSTVVRLVLSNDITPETDLPPAIGQLVADVIPPISRLRPEILDFPAWRFVQSVQRPITATFVVEALALLLQRWFNWPVGFSGCELDAALRGAAAIFETRNAEAGLRAGEVAIGLLDSLRCEAPDRLRVIFQERFEAYSKENLSLGASTAAIARSAQLRGIPWSTVRDINFLRLGHGQYSNVFSGSESTRESSIGAKLAKSKPWTNAVLAAAGLPVAAQQAVRGVKEALGAARWIGFPVVVKPAAGNLGRSITVGVANEKQLGEAFEQARTVSREVVIESVIEGNEHRLLVIGGKFFAATWRQPAQVKGDGVSTVHQLVDRENLDPDRQPGAHSSLKPILIDGVAHTCLTEQGLSPEAVPQSDQVVFLRRVSNVSQGGTTADVTDMVHPSIREIAERAAAALGIDVCGVDFITSDIGRPYWETGGAICEVNTRPLLRTYLAAFDVTPRDAADAIVRRLYPEGSPSRNPVVTILTGSSKTVLQDAIHTAAVKAGRQIGLASSKGTIIGTQGYPIRSLHHLDAVEAITVDGTVDTGIVVVTPHEVVHSGVGLDRIDLAILPSGDRSALAGQACEVLARIADGHVIDEDDPAVLDRALECLGVTRGEKSQYPADLPRASGTSAAILPLSSIEQPNDSDRSDFTLLLLGDIGFGESYVASPRMARLRRMLAIKGHRFSLARVIDLLKDADLTVGNLKVPLATTPNPDLQDRKKFLGWSDPDETVAALVEAGFDAVSLANNHSLDCGAAGLGETIRRVHDSGIAAFGAGADLSAAGRALVRTVRVGPVERTIVVFACFEFRKKYDEQFTWYASTERPGINPIQPDAIAGQIADLRKTVPTPLFIAYPHWGTTTATRSNISGSWRSV